MDDHHNCLETNTVGDCSPEYEEINGSFSPCTVENILFSIFFKKVSKSQKNQILRKKCINCDKFCGKKCVNRNKLCGEKYVNRNKTKFCGKKCVNCDKFYGKKCVN